jgi:hypothetical protein
VRIKTDILFGVTGQSITYRAMQGRPSSATCTVFDDGTDDDGTAEFTVAATVDSVSTGITTSAGPSQADPTLFGVSTTAGFQVGRKYVLSEEGVREWVEVVEILASSVRVRYPLKNDFTVAAVIDGTTLSAVVDATWVASEDNLSDNGNPFPDYRARWEYVVGGVTYVSWSYFDVVRGIVAHEVDIADVTARQPGLHDSLPVDYVRDQGRAFVDSAWRAVRADFQSVGMDVAAVRDDEVIDELVILRCLWMFAESGWRPPQFDSATFVELKRTGYERFWEQHIKVTNKHPVAAGTGANAERAAARPLWRK